MADSEDDYSSSDDSDYVPGGSESESEEDVQEENKDGEREEGKKKKPKKDATVNRKRKGGIKLEDEEHVEDVELDEDEEKELQEERRMLEEERLKAKEAEEEEKEKKKADDLWKSLLSDVGQRPKPSSSKTEVSSKPSERLSQENKREAEKRPPPVQNSEKASSKQETVTVTKVFDFAGEEVKVSENVKVTSQEAKAILQKADKPSTNLTPSQPPLGIKRKPGGVGALLGKINKKPKMSVLEKSKLDWDSFKRKEGIEEDLKIHNKGKDGFLQKQDFLMETDLRQYEVERKLRMGQSGR